MKTIEEKAKAYDESVERAKQIAAQGGASRYLVTQIFPELAESKDERIRKCICMALTDVDEQRFKDFGTTLKDCLAYLEKQKEPKPISSCDIVPYIDDAIAALQDMWREEKIAFDWDDVKDMIEDVARHFYQKEQKPNVEICPHSIKSKSYRENGIPAESISDELIDIIKGEFEGFRRLLKKKGIDYEPQRGYWEGFARLFDSSAREYVKEQKPAWSEDDKRTVDAAIYWLERRLRIEKAYNISTEDSPLSMRNTAERLKSLRPSWKPSEEQIGCFERLIAFNNPEPEDIKGCESLLEQLKKL